MANCPVPPASSYVPTSLVTTFNGVPHIDIDLNTVPDDFNISLDYFETIIIWACVPILAVVCLFILMTIYFICVCCCCCCQQHEKRSKASKATCGVLVTIVAVFCLALVGVGLWAEFEVNQNINEFVDSGRDANNILQGIQTSTDSYNFDVLDSNLTALRSAIRPSGGAARVAVDRMILQNLVLERAFADIESKTSSIVNLSDPLDVVDVVELVRHWVVIAYLIVTALMLFIVALAICCGAGCSSPICPVIALFFFSLFTFTMWIAVGANLAFLIVSADICVDPDTLLRNATSSTGDVPPEIVDYYLVCDESCISSPLNPSFFNSSEAFKAISREEDIVRMYIDANHTELQDMLDTVVLQFNNSENAIGNITELSNCTGLNGDYLNALNSFCDNGYLYNLILFSMACGLAVFMLILVLCGCFFAGLLSRGKEYDDETVVYDFPNDGSSPWDSYGTHQHYQTGRSSQQQYTQFQESYSLRTSPPPNEPPKYTELTARETELNVPTANGGRPNSGQYDHFEP